MVEIWSIYQTMRHLPLNAIRAFASVYLTGGIRPAGRALGVSHSSIAKHIKDLEAALGTPLLERTGATHVMQFSPSGEALGKQAVRSLKELDNAWSAIMERRGHRSVVISTTPSVASLWLLPRMPKLALALPNVEVSVLADQRMTDVSEGRFDLAIRMGGQGGEHEAHLMDDALVPVVSRRVLDRHRESNFRADDRNIADTLFRAMPLLHDRDPNAGWDRWFRRFPHSDIDVQAGPRFNASDLVLRAAKLGQGIALARLRLAAPDLADGSLATLSEERIVLPDAYKLVSDPEQVQRRGVASVRAWLLEEAQSDTIM